MSSLSATTAVVDQHLHQRLLLLLLRRWWTRERSSDGHALPSSRGKGRTCECRSRKMTTTTTKIERRRNIFTRVLALYKNTICIILYRVVIIFDDSDDDDDDDVAIWRRCCCCCCCCCCLSCCFWFCSASRAFHQSVFLRVSVSYRARMFGPTTIASGSAVAD